MLPGAVSAFSPQSRRFGDTLEGMSGSVVTTWVAIAALVLAAIALAIVLVRTHGKRREHIDVDRAMAASLSGKSGHHGRVWVVVNPTKLVDPQSFRARVSSEVLRRTSRPVMWIETTAADPGTGQAIEALRHRPSLIVAAGGDGTVRAVAAGVAHSGVDMAVLPVGTGNLLARNLGIPLELDRALDVALTPVARPMDLAWIRMKRVSVPPDLPAEGALLRHAGAAEVRTLPEGTPEPALDEYAYVVIAGVGFDGQTMAETTPELKRKIGWTAYFFTALRSLRIERMKATVTIFHDEGQAAGSFIARRTAAIPKAVENAVRQSHTLGAEGGVLPAEQQEKTWDMTALQARSILFANCGVLPFAVLAPDATVDDGLLDVIAINTRAGLFGWAYLSFKVFGQSVGLLPVNVKNDPGMIQFRQTRAARVDLSRPYPVQVDGDPIGEARTVLARVSKGALTVRVPGTKLGDAPNL